MLQPQGPNKLHQAVYFSNQFFWKYVIIYNAGKIHLVHIGKQKIKPVTQKWFQRNKCNLELIFLIKTKTYKAFWFLTASFLDWFTGCLNMTCDSRPNVLAFFITQTAHLFDQDTTLLPRLLSKLLPGLPNQPQKVSEVIFSCCSTEYE